MSKEKVDEGLAGTIEAHLLLKPTMRILSITEISDLALAIQKAGYRKVKEIGWVSGDSVYQKPSKDKKNIVTWFSYCLADRTKIGILED